MTNAELKKKVASEKNSDFFIYSGLICKIQRAGELLHLCGYVYIPEGHPLFGKGYDEIDIDVHGGLTFSERVGKYWLIGFDCAHMGDIVPYMYFKNLMINQGEYRDWDYVDNELKSMAWEVAAIEKPHYENIDAELARLILEEKE
jgi:hypothetical protein